MAGISKIILVGNLGRDPETRYTPNGQMNVQFTLAVNRTFRDQAGQQQERTNWFRVTAWAKLAETLDGLTQNGYLGKGKQVFVEGRFEAREYQDQNGQTRTSLDVNATDVLLLGSRLDAEGGQFGGGQRPSGGPRGGDEPDDAANFDDVPF